MKNNEWKKSLRKNKIKTFFTISLFVISYFGIGLVIDIARYSSIYKESNIEAVSYAVLTMQLFPYIASLMSLIACVSIFVTLCMHNKIMLAGKNYIEISGDEKDIQKRELSEMVKRIAFFSGLKYTPKLFVIDEDHANAFASGYSEKSAMLAVTRGLINILTEKELQAVVAHEISHIRHLDIRLTLVASVLTNITSIALDYLFFNSLNDNRDNRDSNRTFYMVIYIVRLVLPAVTAFMMLVLSRSREYMADAGCVDIMGDNKPLGSALIKIHQGYKNNSLIKDAPYEYTRSASYIFNPKSLVRKKTIADLFSTHPTLEERLRAIGIEYKDTVN